MKALLIIDVQNDFMPQGALAIAGADTIIPVINQIQSYFPLVVATQDWHPPHHQSFASTHPGHNVFTDIQIQDKAQTLWPDHCVQGTEGAAFDTALNIDKVEAIFRKGTDIDKDSYSAFYDNHHQKNTGLAGFLQARGVRELYFSGVCADICVYYSILDAIGNTPLVEIKKLNPNPNVKILVKLEYTNPGGSIKDRAARFMIEAGEKSGKLTPAKTVIEATSGNTGIGLALVCAVKGYRLLLAMSDAASIERRKILKARGAEILLTPGHLGTDGAIEEVYRLVRENPETMLAGICKGILSFLGRLWPMGQFVMIWENWIL